MSKTLTVGSTFTGVGGADLGFEWAGFDIAWQCELDKWKRSVLAAHWPSVPCYDDITTMLDPPPVDVMVGGFPCQDLSVAGQRKGFTGERSVLAFEFLRIAEAIKPRWIVLENVPGLLSSNKGLDFQRLLSEVAACGYGVGYRCLDAKYFGVPQRRRRIFVVARRAEANINPRVASGLALRALCESGGGDITPCVPPWQETARGAGEGASGGCVCEPDPAGSPTKRYGKGVNSTLDDGSIVISDGGGLAFRKSRRAQTMNDDETWVEGDHANTLNSFDVGDVRTTHAVVASPVAIAFGHTQGIDIQPSTTHTPTLRVGGGGAAVAQPPSIVRKLTPTECEALMGWPRNHTAPEGIKAPDSRRYAACGDGIVANVAYWIAQRIKMIESEQT